MSRIIAIDWDRREARAVIVEKVGSKGRVVNAVSVPLPPQDAEKRPGGETVGLALAPAVSRYLGRGSRVLVGLGGDQVQLKLLKLPPAPDLEVPDMVRMQMERELPNFGDDDAVDFVPLKGDEASARQILAVAAAAEELAESAAACKAMSCTPDRITLRAWASASLLQRSSQYDGSRVSLLVCPLAEEADLIVLEGDQVVMMRTVRLPGAGGSEYADEGSVTDASMMGLVAQGLDQRQARLIAQIRRTIAAARMQGEGHGVETIYLFTSQSEKDGNARDIGRQLDMPAVAVDPLRDIPEVAASDLSEIQATGLANRFAASLGMALLEAEGKPPEYDFLNPRRRPEVKKFRREHALAAAAASLLLACLFGYMYMQLVGPEREIRRLQAEAAEIRKVNADLKYPEVNTQVAAIEGWRNTHVSWVREFARLSEKLRPEPLGSESFNREGDTFVTSLTMSLRGGQKEEGGVITLAASTADPASMGSLITRLGDDLHEVPSPAGNADESDQVYGWKINSLTINVPSSRKAIQVGESNAP